MADTMENIKKENTASSFDSENTNCISHFSKSSPEADDNSENIVEIRNVSMRFNLSKEKVDNLKEYVVKALKHQLMFDEFYALRNVSFSVKRGEPFAIVGENGCGKSTLLKVISGIFYPSKGSVTVRGTVAPLIELGAGFDMDLTARENIYLNGAVLGYDTAFMESKFQEIMDFAELWDFVDVPVKNFSSGMVARLGFAIATMVVPDLLIVDEILAVGDFMFQQKCERKMQEMIDAGATLIFVSHSSDQVRKLCKKAIWLKHGVAQMVGEVNQVCDAYIHDMENGGHGLVQEPPEEEAPPPPPPLEEPPKKTYPFLNYLRLAAAAMIVWDHLGPFRAPQWHLGQIVENTLNRPLGIIQSFGALGVVLFFLISGFLVAHSASSSREGRLSFGIKRFSHIYLPLLFSFCSFYVVQRFVAVFTGSTWWSQFTPKQWLMGGTLACYFVGQADVINGTVWYLFPLLLFYLLAFLCYPWIKKRPALSIAFLEAVVAVGALCAAHFSLPLVLQSTAAMLWYICFPIFGMLLYYLKEKHLSLVSFLLLGGINYLILLKSMTRFAPQYYESSPYLISFAYGFLLFALALSLEEHFRPNLVVDSFSRISYSIYLTHMTYGSLLLTFLAPVLGNTAAFLLTLCCVLFIAVAHYRLCEQPVARLTKQLTKKFER